MSDSKPVAQGVGDESTDWNTMAQADPTIRQMLAAGIPMTRENYLDTHFNGDVPEDWDESAEMELPPGLQSGQSVEMGGMPNFQGVGQNELPAGPMPIQEGATGQGAKVAPLGQAVPETQSTARPVPSQISQPGSEARSPLVQDEVPTPGAQFRQQSWKPPQTKQGG